MDNQLEELLKSVNEMKRLMIFALMRGGATQNEIAKAMGIGQASVSRLFSDKKAGETRKRKR